MVRDLLANGKVLQALVLNPVASPALNGGLTFATNGGTRRREELYLLFRTGVAADGINSCVDVTA